MIAGRAQVFFASIAVALPLARDGKARALAVTSLTRAPAAPELPTMSEPGLPGLESLAWFGVLGCWACATDRDPPFQCPGHWPYAIVRVHLDEEEMTTGLLAKSMEPADAAAVADDLAHAGSIPL